MNRLIVLTTIGLFAVSLMLNLVFAERTGILWDNIQVQSSDVLLTFRNTGKIPWERGTFAVRIFEDAQLLANIRGEVKKTVLPNKLESVCLLLDKPLPVGKMVRVEAFFVQGQAPVVKKAWDNIGVFDLPNLRKKMAPRNATLGKIYEPELIGDNFSTIDLQKAMAVF